MNNLTYNEPESLTSIRPESLSIRTLYKFRAWDTNVDPHGRDILTDNNLYFSSAESFNDPLEARIPLRYDLCSEDYLFDLFLEHASFAYPDQSPDEHLSLAKDWVIREIIKKPGEIERWSMDHYAYCIKNYGIVSLTEDNENVVQWSHYADGHRGFCVGLDLDSLLMHRHLLARSKISVDLFKVRYRTNMPILIPSSLTPEEFSILPLTSKANDWMYEKEYRLISLNGPGEMAFPDEYISEVILGCNISAENKNEIIDLLSSKGKHIPLLQSSLKELSYGLKFENVEY